MIDWYTQALSKMCRFNGWAHYYAVFTGHFVDDFGNMVRVYAPDEQGIHHLMP